MSANFGSEGFLALVMPPEIEAETREMQMALGQAISAWAGVEGHLCSVFTLAAGSRSNPRPATEAFCAVKSFEVQLDMTSAAMKAAYRKRPQVLDLWKELRNRIDEQRKWRNRLAHGQILQTAKDRRWSVDFLPFHHLGAGKSLEIYAHWKVADIQAIQSAFKDTSSDISRIHFALLTRGTLPQLHAAPSAPPGRSQGNRQT